MPEPSKRVITSGIKKAEEEFQRYIRFRLEAEKSGDDLLKELRTSLAKAKANLARRKATGG